MDTRCQISIFFLENFERLLQCQLRHREQAATRATTFSSTVHQQHLRPTAPPSPALHILICISEGQQLHREPRHLGSCSHSSSSHNYTNLAIASSSPFLCTNSRPRATTFMINSCIPFPLL